MPINAVTRLIALIPNPASAQGTSRCSGSSGSCLANPMMRRSRAPTLPISSTSPRKCKSIMKAHHHLLYVMAWVNFQGVGSNKCTIDPTVHPSHDVQQVVVGLHDGFALLVVRHGLGELPGRRLKQVHPSHDV